MDHIYSIEGSNITGIKVPLVCTDRFTFDNGDFDHYPSRCGMLKDSNGFTLLALHSEDLNIDELAPFLQAWLFFGTLHSLFRQLIKTDYEWTDFIETSDGGEAVISTKMLPMYIWYWAAHESTIPPECNYGAIWVTKLVEMLDLIVRTLVEDDRQTRGPFADRKVSDRLSQSPGHRVLLSIIVLCETIRTAGEIIYSAQPAAYRPKFDTVFPSLLIERLRSAGWCPWQILQLGLDQNLDCQTAYVLSMMDRTQLCKDHSRCSKAKCFGYDVDYDTYTTKHVTANCCCVQLPRSDDSVSLCVSWILEDGGLPLLTLTDEGADDEATLNVTYSSLNNNAQIPRYVAISHVWSDGLGNQDRNAMPLCILRKIQRQVNALFEDGEEPIHFWVDTICVPKTNKNPALQAMLQTYENAKIVLVLDASLEAVSIKTPPQERLLRIRVSPWMQRLWTLQEGWVAQDLVFQFAEGAHRALSIVQDCVLAPNPMKLRPELLINPKKSIQHANKLVRALGLDWSTIPISGDKMLILRQELEKKVPGYPNEYDKRLADLINESQQFDQIFRDGTIPLIRFRLNDRSMRGPFKTENLSLIFNALKDRTTSRKEDETYCLANLMKMPVLPIITLPPEERMKKLLSLMPQVPASFIFSHQFMRMTDEGFSWAPTTFMHISAVGYDGTTFGRIKNGALHVSLPGLKIQKPPLIGIRDIAKRVDRPSKLEDHTISVAVRNERWLYDLVFVYPPDHPVIAWSDYDGMNLMVIVRGLTPDVYCRTGDTIDAALVSLITQDDKVCKVKFLTTVWMRRSPVQLTEESAIGCYTGEWLDDDYSWRIL